MVNVRVKKKLDLAKVKKILSKQEGVIVADLEDPLAYKTPDECGGDDWVYVSRIRLDTAHDNGLSMWIVADNLRKGAALNAIQIVESLANEYY